VLLGSYDLTREEIWVNLFHRTGFMVSRSQRAIPVVRASAWRCPTIWMPTGMPSIASIGTVTAGAPRIEVGLLKTESPVLPRPRGAGPGEPRADQRFGQWGDRGEPVLRLLALQQA